MRIMNKALALGLMLALFVLAGCGQGATEAATYKNISADELNDRMQNEDLFLVDVHIPEQPRIKGTDLFVSYLDVKENADKFPADKDEPIIAYCRGGGMSIDASLELIGMGYTDINSLAGGAEAWKAAGYPTE